MCRWKGDQKHTSGCSHPLTYPQIAQELDSSSENRTLRTEDESVAVIAMPWPTSLYRIALLLALVCATGEAASLDQHADKLAKLRERGDNPRIQKAVAILAGKFRHRHGPGKLTKRLRSI